MLRPKGSGRCSGCALPRTWTSDLKERKIRVNAISPGVVPTEGYQSLGNEEEGRHKIETAECVVNILSKIGTDRAVQFCHGHGHNVQPLQHERKAFA